MDIPYSKEEIRAATHETIVRNGLRSCYIRPLVFRGAGPMGLYPLDCPVDVVDRRVGVGRLPRRRGQAARRARRRSPRWRRISSERGHPAGQGDRPVPQLRARQDRGRQGRLRGGDPARRPRHGLRGLGREPLRDPRRRDRHAAATGRDILGGISRLSAIQIARDLGYEVVERDIARGELYLADEVFMTGTAAELTPLREIDDRPVGDGQPGPITRESSASSRTRCTAARSATRSWLDLVAAPAPAPRRERRPRLRLHPARRHAGGGHVAVGGGEAARRARARRPRRAT